MIIKLTLCGLVMVLIAVLAISYYMNEEGFKNITSKPATVDQLEEFALAVQSAISSLGTKSSGKPADPITIRINDLTRMESKVLLTVKYVAKGLFPSSQIPIQSDTINYNTSILTDVSVPLRPLDAASAADPSAPWSPDTPSTDRKGDPKDPKSRKKRLPAGMPQTGAAPSDPFDFDDMMTPINATISPQVNVSDDAYAAMLLKQKSEILQDLQKIVRNEILAQRSTNPVARDKSRSSDTHSTEQGKEYSRKNHKRDSCTDDSECDHPNGYKPNQCDEPSCEKPDMREYIRKDSIPCMNCNLDY